MLSIALIAAVSLIPRLGPGPSRGDGGLEAAALGSATREALITGTTESGIVLGAGNWRVIAGAIGYWAFDNAVLWATFHAFGFDAGDRVVLLGYLIGQLGGLLPIPGGIGGIDGGLIGTLIVYGAPAAVTAAAVLAYRVILFWLPLLARRRRLLPAAPRHAEGRRSSRARRRWMSRAATTTARQQSGVRRVRGYISVSTPVHAASSRNEPTCGARAASSRA